MAQRPKFAKERYEEDLKDRINLALRREFADVRLQRASITKVELTNDYAYAKVYWDTFDQNGRGDIKEAIDGIAPRMRSHLAHVMKVRHTPHIEFIYDSQFEDEHHITQLLAAERPKE